MNTKYSAEAMRLYGGKHIFDLYSLNFGGPKISTIKRVGRKSVQFVPGEHREIFKAIAHIYKDAKFAHGIEGPILMILAEDETKVKSKVAYEPKWDMLIGFVGPRKTTFVFLCTS